MSLLELSIVLAVMGILLSLGLPSLRGFMQQQRVDRSTDAILWQITVARSYAIRTGSPVDLVVDKPGRKLLVQDSTKVWSVMDFSDNGLTVDSLALSLDSGKLTFSFRGFCLNCPTGGAVLSVYAGGRHRQIQVGFLGRAERLAN